MIGHAGSRSALHDRRRICLSSAELLENDESDQDSFVAKLDLVEESLPSEFARRQAALPQGVVVQYFLKPESGAVSKNCKALRSQWSRSLHRLSWDSARA